MLQAPSHLSRVCGHGHIKKFWLMQTQKENQACESKSSVLFSPASRPLNRGSVKGLDNSPWSQSPPLPHSPGYGDASVTPSKHASFTCAESLSPHSRSCKASPPSSPHSTGSTGALAEKECLSGHCDGVDSLSRTLCRDAHPATPSPRPHPPNVVSEQHCQASAEVDRMGPSSLHTNCSCEAPLSSSTQHSPESHSSHVHSTDVQPGYSCHPLSESTSYNQSVKLEDRSSLANSSRDCKPFPSHARFASSTGVDHSQKGRGGGILGNKMLEVIDRDHDRSSQAYMVHPVLKACSLCGTTKTPMWRSGPQGPKSLCNACGIRFKKYRSFPGQSEPPELMPSSLLGPVASKPLSRPLKRKQSPLLSSYDPPRPQKMSIKPAVADVGPRQQQKKSKWHELVVRREHGELKDLTKDSSSPWCAHPGPPSLKKIYGCSPFQSKFKKLAPMDEHLNVSRVFAKDEEEAAVLLMHLSCGLVY